MFCLISFRALKNSQPPLLEIHRFTGSISRVSVRLTSSISLIEAYLGPGALLSYRDAVRFELSNAKAARPNPRAPADAAKAKTERPDHLEARTGLTILAGLVEAVLRDAMV